MTYDQSLQNIRKLLEYIRPVEGSTLYFKFFSESKFELSYEKIDIVEQEDRNLPFAAMYYQENGQDILTYSDSTCFWSINMADARILRFGSKSKNITTEARQQFQTLVRMAKKG